MKALITADFHLRTDKPRCRLDDDWMLSQINTLGFIQQIANDKNVPLIVVGDIFNTPNVPASIVSMVLDCLLKTKHASYILAGNHDLPYHSWDNVDSCSYGILNKIMAHIGLEVADLSDFGQWCHFGQETQGEKTGIRFIHQLVFPDIKSIPPNVDAMAAPELLVKYKDDKWIFTGDYHHSFHYEKNGRHVINPGCIIRQAADLMDYQPKLCLVDTKKEEVEWINIPDPAKMVTDEYLRAEEVREDRISAFVEGVKKSGSVSLSFLDNLEEAMAKNDLDGMVVNMINELVEQGEEK